MLFLDLLQKASVVQIDLGNFMKTHCIALVIDCARAVGQLKFTVTCNPIIGSSNCR